MAAASPTVWGCFLRSSAAAVPRVRLMLVPVSPVGHGEDVQFVDLLLLQIEGGRRVDHGLGKRRSVNALSHIGCSFLSMGAGRFSR